VDEELGARVLRELQRERPPVAYAAVRLRGIWRVYSARGAQE
jgi:hypothetical protein